MEPGSRAGEHSEVQIVDPQNGDLVLGSLSSALSRIAAIEAKMAQFGLSTNPGAAFGQPQSIAPAAAIPSTATSASPSGISSAPSRAGTPTGTFAQALASESLVSTTSPTNRSASTATGASPAPAAATTTFRPVAPLAAGQLNAVPSSANAVPSSANAVTSQANAVTSQAVTSQAAADPRWTELLTLASASLAAGARGPATPSTPIPAYTGTLSAEIEARRRSDGSLNPNDLPSTLGLTPAELELARLANSVPNLALALGQNEGVATPGATPSVNDSYDLLAWVGQLQAMAAGTAPPLVQDNGYTWTDVDIGRNLKIALDNVHQNKELYNARWESRWAMLRTAGYEAIADQEKATTQLVDPNGAPGSF